MLTALIVQGGNQPIHIAANNGRVEIIEYLLKEHDPTLIDAITLVCILQCMLVLLGFVNVGWYKANSFCQCPREFEHI